MLTVDLGELMEQDIDQCPITGEMDCGMCSGEYCERHFCEPCDCNVTDRHRPEVQGFLAVDDGESV